MLQMGREGGMPESYAAQASTSVSQYMSSFTPDQMKLWLTKQVTLAYYALAADGGGAGV